MDSVLSSSSATDVNSFLSAAEKEALKAATFQRLHPQIYLERFLEEKIRPDGRSIADDENEDTHAWRNVEVNVGSITTTSGSALVRLGNTTVVCGVKAEICEPELDNSEKGFLVPNVDLPALCSPKFKTGPPPEEAQVLSERLNEVLGNGMIPLSSLCIYPGKSAWVLYVDATVINYDGNVFDAALMAMVCALKNVILPHAEFNPELNRTICTRPKSDPSKPARKLIIEEDLVPLSFSFGVFAGSYLLPDPTASEESLLDTTISIILNTRARILALSQLGTGVDKFEAPGQGVADISYTREADTLARCISLAKKRQAVIMKKVYDT